MAFEGIDRAGRLSPVLDPAAARLATAWASPPYFHQLGPQHAREVLEEIQGDGVDGPGVDVEFRAAVAGPSGLVGFWVVRPHAGRTPSPVVLYVHGGRFMVGDAATHGRLVRELATRSGAAMVVPEYTRAPEARFPVALEEIYALLVWLAEHGGELGLRGDRIAMAGDCAGATLAVGVALLSKQRGGPRVRAQLLYYPWTDPVGAGVTHESFAADAVLSRAAARWYWDQYCDDVDHDDPVLAPLRATAEDLAGLPPAMVVTAEVDVLRDEAEAFARRLRAVGVAVVTTRYLGMPHDFVSLRPLRTTPAARTAVREGAAFLAEALLPAPRRTATT